MQTKILAFIFILSLTLFFTNSFALKANLYWTTSWADIITHSLGGMVVLGLIMLVSLQKTPTKGFKVFRMMSLVVFIGVVWELFELYNGMTFITDKGYWLDTAGDIFFDILGAYLGYRFLTMNSVR